MRLLLVEDDQQLQKTLATWLRKREYSVDVIDNGADAVSSLFNNPYDVVILDLGLPDMEGQEVIVKARKQQIKVPILVLTARSAWQQKVQALEAGADDYVVKPFHFEELEARLNVLIRRQVGHTSSILVIGPIRLDMATKQVLMYEQVMELTAYEYRLLECLMLHAGQVLSKTQLIEHIYEQDFDRDSNTIEVFIRRLRKKLDPDQALNLIETVRGQGYRFHAFITR